MRFQGGNQLNGTNIGHLTYFSRGVREIDLHYKSNYSGRVFTNSTKNEKTSTYVNRCHDVDTDIINLGSMEQYA